jgi:hypothetical protein
LDRLEVRDALAFHAEKHPHLLTRLHRLEEVRTAPAEKPEPTSCWGNQVYVAEYRRMRQSERQLQARMMLIHVGRVRTVSRAKVGRERRPPCRSQRSVTSTRAQVRAAADSDPPDEPGEPPPPVVADDDSIHTRLHRDLADDSDRGRR